MRSSHSPFPPSRRNDTGHSCSTFVLAHGDELFVGHNVDDYVDVPGLIVVNKRSTRKESVCWRDLNPGALLSRAIARSSPRIRWVSRYGSVTYNTGGKEFIDGGMNEAGLYVGEMTLFGTQYPRDDSRPRFYHHLWMQYLLDNYERVDQVVASLSEATVDGHCQWHFFVADRSGQAAVIEFLGGNTLVYSGTDLPLPVLCNAPYASEMEALGKYAGFGGTEAVNFQEAPGAQRFAWAATMLRGWRDNPSTPAVDYAFQVLRQIKGDNNKWGILYDVARPRIYFYTYKADRTRYLDFSSVDFSGQTPPLMLDIHRDLCGDVSPYLVSFEPAFSRETIFWRHVRFAGLAGQVMRLFFVPEVVRRMDRYARGCTPVPEPGEPL